MAAPLPEIRGQDFRSAPSDASPDDAKIHDRRCRLAGVNNRALSVGEIQQLMAAPIPGPASCAAGLAGAALILALRRRRRIQV